MIIPRLETGRLLLREWRDSDLDAMAAMLDDEEVMRFLGGRMTRFDAWRSLAALAGQWMLRGYGAWAVERKSDGAMMGRVGLLFPDGWPSLEVGWTLGRPYWGHGYATEAARAALDYGFLTQPVEKLISLIDPQNIASQGVAQRLGETRGPSHIQNAGKESFACEIWSITRAQWKRNNSAP